MAIKEGGDSGMDLNTTEVYCVERAKHQQEQADTITVRSIDL